MPYLQILLLIFIYCLLAVLQMIGSRPGSDHCYSISLINGIHCNGHQFVTGHPNILGGKYFVYPQLFHWILSFLPSVIVERYYKMFGLIIGLLQLTMFIIFAYSVYPSIQTDISFELYIILSGLIFILTPFSYAIWNPKNTGISARGFGLLLGQIYLYVIIWYYFFGNIIFLLCAFLLGFVILISSQFSMQFVIFSAPLFALFFKNPFFLPVPVLAFAMFYLIMPVISRNFIRGQIAHKTIYYKYLAEQFILKLRYSIWRDFVWDFWVRGRSDFKRSILYIYYNPLLSLIFGLPFFSLFAVYFFLDKRAQGLVLSNNSVHYLAIPVVVSLIIFLLTSFRKTRFLGEPERYMEFCIPQISVLGATLFSYSSLSAQIVLGISFLLVIGQFILRSLHVKYGFNKQYYETVDNIIEILGRMGESDIKARRIFSNNAEINTALLTGNWKVLNISFTSHYTGQFHIKDIFTLGYPCIEPNVILPLIKEFKIEYFVLDTSILPDYDGILEDDYVFLEEEKTVNHCKIFKVCLKN